LVLLNSLAPHSRHMASGSAAGPGSIALPAFVNIEAMIAALGGRFDTNEAGVGRDRARRSNDLRGRTGAIHPWGRRGQGVGFEIPSAAGQAVNLYTGP